MRAGETTGRPSPAVPGFRFVSDQHRDLFDHLDEWSAAICTCAGDSGRHIKQSYVAATFSAFCVPWPELDQDALVVARCCLLFFLVDDGSAEQLNAFDLFLHTGESADHNEPIAGYTSLLADLEALGCETGHFVQAIRAWASSMSHEQDIKIGTLTAESYYALRRDTIFVSCVVLCWMSLLRTAVPVPAVSANVLDLATRIVILANDLGSMRADERPPDDQDTLVDINTVLLRSRALGSMEQAVREAVIDHNALAARFRAARADLLRDVGPDSTPTSTFLTVVRRVVNGNLDGTRHLTGERYPGSSETLRLLDSV